MTDKQAARIERLLKMHALQLHSILAELVALTMLVTDTKDAAGYQRFAKSQGESLKEQKEFLTSVMDKITEDEHAENKAFKDDLMAAAIERLKREPVGFKPPK